MEIRVQKYISECGLMSRRAAEREILLGHVTVNGTVVKLGDRLDPRCDELCMNGKRLEKTARAPVYLMLYKPVGYITALADDRGRPTVADLLQNVGVRVYPIGRLDMDTEGLLLCTNDGAFADAMMHPRGGIEKIYLVKVAGALSTEKLAVLRGPMFLDGYLLRPVTVEVVGREGSGTILKMTLHEGRNRQVRRMCEQAGLRVIHLKRISVGSLTLGRLSSGQWRYLTDEELLFLRGQIAAEETVSKKNTQKNADPKNGAKRSLHCSEKQLRHRNRLES